MIKIEFMRTSFIVRENVKINNVMQQPEVECVLDCRFHFHGDNQGYAINCLYGSDVFNRIKDRLTQAGYNFDFITDFFSGRTFKVSAKTTVHPEDSYDEAIGKRIAETKARIKVFKMLKMISDEFSKYVTNCAAEVAKLKDKNDFLVNREMNHLNDVLNSVQQNPDYVEQPQEESANEVNE